MVKVNIAHIQLAVYWLPGKVPGGLVNVKIERISGAEIRRTNSPTPPISINARAVSRPAKPNMISACTTSEAITAMLPPTVEIVSATTPTATITKLIG